MQRPHKAHGAALGRGMEEVAGLAAEQHVMEHDTGLAPAPMDPEKQLSEVDPESCALTRTQVGMLVPHTCSKHYGAAAHLLSMVIFCLAMKCTVRYVQNPDQPKQKQNSMQIEL
jgi:hypothetical protein